MLNLLRRYGLPTESAYGEDELFSALLLDKKIADGKINLVFPKGIGWCEIVPVSRDALRQLLAVACRSGCPGESV